MKPHLLTLALVLLTLAAHGAIDYSGIQNVPIPQDFEGVYLRLDTGAISNSYPADWETAPWINPFFGGVGIATSPLLRPVITGSDRILNLEVGTLVDGGSNFAPGESGSSTHVGPGAGQFQLGAPGTIGLVFEPTVGGPSYYGWVDLEINNAGPGRLIDWAFGDEGEGALVPEAGTAIFGALVLAGAGARRRRHPAM